MQVGVELLERKRCFACAPVVLGIHQAGSDKRAQDDQDTHPDRTRESFGRAPYLPQADRAILIDDRAIGTAKQSDAHLTFLLPN